MKKITMLFASALIAVSCAHAPKKSCCGDDKEVQACCKEKKDCKEESCKKT